MRPGEIIRGELAIRLLLVIIGGMIVGHAKDIPP